MHPRSDAVGKVSGTVRYVADLELPDMAHAAVARSPFPHAGIVAIDPSAALDAPGVLGVFTASDPSAAPYGRKVRDVPLLATDEVRFVGEPVVAVVAESRAVAERAAELVEIRYEELPAATDLDGAVEPGAPLVHEAPWRHLDAVVSAGNGPNLQSIVTHGARVEVETALAASAHVVDRTYRTQAVHHGYLEPHACVASWQGGRLRVWVASKSPYMLRNQLSACLGLDPSQVVIEPVTVGGDFGGKGSPMDAPLCSELSRLTGRPVKMVLRYSEDLAATECRHPSRFRVRMGADVEGHLTAVAYDILLDGGAYAGYKPAADVSLHGAVEPGCYRIPAFFAECRVAYTNTLPKGHMRAPGQPQMIFASESALDELALDVGIDPVEIRRRNLLTTGDTDAVGVRWLEYRTDETLDAALDAVRDQAPDIPEGWLHGRGLAIFARVSSTGAESAMCLVPLPDGRIRAEVPYVETGAGSHTVVRDLLRQELGCSPDDIDVVQVDTDRLPFDLGASRSRTTAITAYAVDAAVKAWRDRLEDDEEVEVAVDERSAPPLGSIIVMIADVAVDPRTGQLRVLELLAAIDVATIVNEKAHQMQIDGGAVMGFGYACLEDLDIQDGQVWAANLGDYRLATARDAPRLRTVLVPGGRGHGTANVKSIGEATTPPVAAAIANAVADATGRRIRTLPITAEAIYRALVDA